MAKIIIYKNINEVEYDLFHKTDYLTLNNRIQTERNGNWPNFANKLWLQGLISEISVKENEIDYLTDSFNSEQLNEKYDLMIFPSAIIFSNAYRNAMEKLAKEFSQLRIPVYVISCGVQAKSYSELEQLIDQIGDVASRFIDSVYQTGGEFSLRGYFTKEFFDKLGFPTAVVTGCPSLYQVGRNLSIQKKDVKEKELKPVVNGQNYMFSIPFYQNIFKEYKDAVFVDQDHYGKYLYDPAAGEVENYSLKGLLELVKRESALGVELLSSERLFYFADMPQWRAWLKQGRYHVSVGARIHGNIMSILCGIPGVVHAWDSRTREMAEFYDIPVISDEELKGLHLFDLYERIDYSQFNKNFAKRYDAYESFLNQCGIISGKMNTENIFFEDAALSGANAPECINREKLKELNRQFNKKKGILTVEEKLLLLYRKIKNDQYSMK